MSNLIKIRDMASKYDVSARTLRYYEDMGLISSTRTDDYAYRLYDEAAVKKLEQILVLRKLNISIKDIKQIFSASGSQIVLEVLGKKVNDIDAEVALLHELKKIVMEFIRQIEKSDFSNDSHVKKLYEKAKDIENKIENPLQHLMEVTTQLDSRKLPNVMVVKLPKFRAVTSGWTTDEYCGGDFWEWGEKNKHLLKNIVWDNDEFILDKEISCETSAFIFAINDDVTPSDTAPYEIIEVEGGLYATAICVDMDDDSMTSLYPQILKWLGGTNFTRDTSRDLMAHGLFTHSDVKKGLGYHQLQRYVPIKFNTDGWKTVYSLATDEVIRDFKIGTSAGGFNTNFIESSGDPTYTFLQNGIHVTNTKHDWDGIDINLKALNIPPNHYCAVDVSGKIIADIATKSRMWMAGMPGYDWLDSHSSTDGEYFRLQHTFPVIEGKPIPFIRVAGIAHPQISPFIIEGIEVTVKPFTEAPGYIESEKIKVIVVESDTDSYFEFIMPKSYNGDKEAFRKEIYDLHLDKWLTMDSNNKKQLTGNPDTFRQDENGHQVLMISIEQDYKKGLR
ncbi:MAG: MerR family transcriptional regulator [Defluviitaleaceae bacterium]|nr:MerR family transcriptional regulator [Defluviitaleaceae bacterium]MCL2262555.1 MerR family transcriptional regulator [Defluviitaleaceae bacterium]